MSPATIRNGVIALVLFCVAGGAFGAMVYWVFEKGDQLTEQIDTLQAQRSQESSRYRLLRQVDATISDRAQIASYFLFKESESIDFLNQVESLAPQVGVALETDGLELVEEKGDQHQWIKVSFSFSGSYDSVERFIKILETMPYVLELTSVNLQVLSSTEWQGEVTMRVRVLTYDT